MLICLRDSLRFVLRPCGLQVGMTDRAGYHQHNIGMRSHVIGWSGPMRWCIWQREEVPSEGCLDANCAKHCHFPASWRCYLGWISIYRWALSKVETITGVVSRWLSWSNSCKETSAEWDQKEWKIIFLICWNGYFTKDSPRLYPDIYNLPTFSNHIHIALGAYHNFHRVRGRVYSGQVASATQTQTR